MCACIGLFCYGDAQSISCVYEYVYNYVKCLNKRRLQHTHALLNSNTRNYLYIYICNVLVSFLF